MIRVIGLRKAHQNPIDCCAILTLGMSIFKRFNNNSSEKEKIQHPIVNIGKIIEDIKIELYMKMDQLIMQIFSKTMATLKHPKQL